VILVESRQHQHAALGAAKSDLGLDCQLPINSSGLHATGPVLTAFVSGPSERRFVVLLAWSIKRSVKMAEPFTRTRGRPAHPAQCQKRSRR